MGTTNTCELCGRMMSAEFKSAVCAFCQQEYQELKQKEKLRKEKITQAQKQSSTNQEETKPTTTRNTATITNRSEGGFEKQSSPVQNPAVDDSQFPMVNTPIPPRVLNEIQGIASIEQAGAIIWLIIGLLQLIAFIVYPWLLVIGIWNIVVSISRFYRVRKIRACAVEIPAEVEKELGWYIAFIVINLVLGAVIGIAGAVVDIIVRDKVLKLRTWFNVDPTASPDANKRDDSEVDQPPPRPVSRKRPIGMILVLIVLVFLLGSIIFHLIKSNLELNLAEREQYYAEYTEGGKSLRWRTKFFDMEDSSGNSLGRATVNDFKMVRTANSSDSITYSYSFVFNIASSHSFLEYKINFYGKQQKYLGTASGTASVFKGNAIANGSVILAGVPIRSDFVNLLTSGY